MSPSDFKAWRLAAGLTQDAAAARFKSSKRQVIRWENGDSPIPSGVAASIAEDAVEDELGPGMIMRGSDLLPKPEPEPVTLPAEEIEYVWSGGTRVPLPPGMKPTTAKEFAERLSPRDVKTNKPTMKLIGPYKGGPIPKGFQVVRVCRVPTDPKGRPWEKGAS